MSAKLGTAILAAGALLMLAGLIALPAGFGPHADATALALGAGIFSTGALFLGAGFYVKARALGTLQVQEKRTGTKSGRVKRIKCEVCQAPAVVLCAPHRTPLCSDCLVGHYDPRSCGYAPLARKASRAASASR